MEKLPHESTPKILKKTDNLQGPNRVQALDTFNPNRWNVAISTRFANSVMINTRLLQILCPVKRLTAKVLQMTHSLMITDLKVSKKWTNFITQRPICLVSIIRPLDMQLPTRKTVASLTALASTQTPSLVTLIQTLHRLSRRLSVLL